VVLHAEGLVMAHQDMGLRTTGLQQFLKSEGFFKLKSYTGGIVLNADKESDFLRN